MSSTSAATGRRSGPQPAFGHLRVQFAAGCWCYGWLMTESGTNNDDLAADPQRDADVDEARSDGNASFGAVEPHGDLRSGARSHDRLRRESQFERRLGTHWPARRLGLNSIRADPGRRPRWSTRRSTIRSEIGCWSDHRHGPVVALALWRTHVDGGHAHWPRGATRTGHSAIYDPVRDRMVVFGGYTYHDVWALKLAGDPTCGSSSPATPALKPLRPHRAIYDPVRDRMVVFGGVGV